MKNKKCCVRPPVWPDATAKVPGYELKQLYRLVPTATKSDPAHYAILAVADSLRDGTARQRQAAERALDRLLESA